MALMNLTKMKDHPALYAMPLAPEVEEVCNVATATCHACTAAVSLCTLQQDARKRLLIIMTHDSCSDA